MLAITSGTIDPREVEEAVRTEAYGGVVTFLGIVRQSAPDGRQVDGLSYEAHEAMALKEFALIEQEIRDTHGDVKLAIVHRVGELRVGEIAVVVSVAAPHRGDAFVACQYAIDELKHRAPIWKKEHYLDGASSWIANDC